jgi:ABC-type lipoprotein export system ATPase subunit
VVVTGGLEAAGSARGDAIIRMTDVIRVYRDGDSETIALRGIDLDVERGEVVAIIGRSGSGKSTLLHLLAGSDAPTAGQVVVDGIDVGRADETQRASMRGRLVGLVFQRQNLVPFLDLAENVQLAAALAGRPVDVATARWGLERVGLGHRADARPEQLSGGEQQRAALATVIVTRPRILLADEITGELDSASAAHLLDLVLDIHEIDETTIVIATHDPDVAARAGRVVELHDGRIVADRRST